MSEVVEIKERISAMQGRIKQLEDEVFNLHTFLDLFHNWDIELNAENRARLLAQMKISYRKLAT